MSLPSFTSEDPNTPLKEQDPWPESEVAHTETLYAIFGLFQAMNLPANGSLRGLVGEELLEWLNTNLVAPDSEEAVELHKLAKPWEDERYWLYLIRFVNIYLEPVCTF